MLVTGLLKNCELDKTYDRLTISAEAKFQTVSMATFRDNKQALYGIFSMFLQLSLHPKTASLSLFRQNYCGRWKQPKKQKLTTLIFTAHAHCFKLKRNLLTGKLPDIKAFLKLFHRHYGLSRSLLLLH